MHDHDHATDDDRSIVSKDLDDVDETDGHRTGHYSHTDVYRACHAEEGASHE